MPRVTAKRAIAPRTKPKAAAKPQPDGKVPAKHSPIELARREEAFRLYRDLGVNRTYARLMAILPRRFGEVSERTLSNWSREDDWKTRIEDHDRRKMAADINNLDPKFDQVDYMLKAAHLALLKALNASVDIVPTRPGEIKQLIDAGRNAIVVCQQLMELRNGGRDGDGAVSKKTMFDELEKVEERIRGVLAKESRAWRYARQCEAVLREHGIEPPTIEAEVITVEATPVVEQESEPLVELPRLDHKANVDVTVRSVDHNDKPQTVADRLAAFRARQ
ncbi:MAG: hypothetical protein KGL39_03490 [Patescibacteria group bacterium]|nr:hypothetical protein [Patescibacteria group bacterium]